MRDSIAFYGSKVDIESIPLGTITLRELCSDLAYLVVVKNLPLQENRRFYVEMFARP